MNRPSLFTLWSRAMRLRCPRCGIGPMFKNWFRMFPECEHCRFRYERAPGFFLGSAYINYGLTAMLTTITYMVLHFGFGYEHQSIVVPLAVFVVLFPLFYFRFARALWLAMDCFIDENVLRDE
ncbi:MAG: DUF983 domain-containing protein [Planctomycetaceae bacterium]